MSYTKLELVKGALAEIGLSDYAFDLSAEQIDQALARLDAMMAEWNGRGVRLGYPVAVNPSGLEGSDDSGIPDVAYEAVITNLAVRIAPNYGKAVSAETRATATRGMNTLFTRSARPKPARLGAMLAGAGAKSTAPFLPEQSSEVVMRPEDAVDFE